MSFNSLYLKNAATWPSYYLSLQNELGATASVVDFGNQGSAGKVNAATFAGRKFHTSGLSPTWTPSEALSAFDTPFDLTLESNWLGYAPILTLNGSDEDMDTPDANYWTRDDSGSNPYSGGMWVKFSGTESGWLFSKYVGTGNNREYLWGFSSGKQDLWQRDESAGVSANLVADAVTSPDVWHFVVLTYDATGGSSAMGGATFYTDGAAIASTATNNGSYVAMENKTASPTIGSQNGASFFEGAILGGPWGPWFTQIELTAAQVKNLYEDMRLGLGI